MADLRVHAVPDRSRQIAQVTPDASRDDRQQREPQGERRRRPAPGAEELALALTDGGGAAMEAHYEEDADGNPLIRIIDGERGETVAVLTPEELRTLTEQTGLPPGLLIRAVS